MWPQEGAIKQQRGVDVARGLSRLINRPHHCHLHERFGKIAVFASRLDSAQSEGINISSVKSLHSKMLGKSLKYLNQNLTQS